MKGVHTTLIVQDTTRTAVGLWRTRTKTWLMPRRSSLTLRRLKTWSLLLWWIIESFCSFEFSSCNLFCCSNTYLLMLNFVSLMYFIFFSWFNPLVFIIFKLCFLLPLWYSTLVSKSCKPLEEDDETIPWSYTVCFWTDLADDVQPFFQFLNTGVIRRIIPSQPLWAKEVGVFFFTQIEPFNQNLGLGSFSVNSNARSVASFHFLNNKWHQERPSKSKDGDGSLSNRQLLSPKRKAH